MSYAYVYRCPDTGELLHCYRCPDSGKLMYCCDSPNSGALLFYCRRLDTGDFFWQCGRPSAHTLLERCGKTDIGETVWAAHVPRPPPVPCSVINPDTGQQEVTTVWPDVPPAATPVPLRQAPPDWPVWYNGPTCCLNHILQHTGALARAAAGMLPRKTWGGEFLPVMRRRRELGVLSRCCREPCTDPECQYCPDYWERCAVALENVVDASSFEERGP